MLLVVLNFYLLLIEFGQILNLRLMYFVEFKNYCDLFPILLNFYTFYIMAASDFELDYDFFLI